MLFQGDNGEGSGERWFWNRLASELRKLVTGRRSPSDFVSRFYMIVDDRPADLDPSMTRALEDFHSHVADFEPRGDVRRRIIGLIGEKELKSHAAHLLQVIDMKAGTVFGSEKDECDQ